MIPNQTIDEVKQVPITAYLQSVGVLPAHTLSGRNQYAYCSPISKEKTPSFFVNERDNVFYDYSTGEKGDVIRLVQKLECVSFLNAIKRLQTFVGSSEPLTLANYQIASDTDVDTHFRITAIRSLQHPKLLEYVENKRGIPYAYACGHVKQLHYTRKGKNYFGVGFRTDAGTWAIRNERFKTWIGKSDITTITFPGSFTYHVFEGFFNYLSALTYYGLKSTNSNVIVLNSVTNLKLALPKLRDAVHVNSWLDNDKAGRNALLTLQNEGVNVVDRSTLYKDYNDFNEFLLHRP